MAVCPNCGSENTHGGFCLDCGYDFRELLQPEPATEEPAPAQVPVAPEGDDWDDYRDVASMVDSPTSYQRVVVPLADEADDIDVPTDDVVTHTTTSTYTQSYGPARRSSGGLAKAVVVLAAIAAIAFAVSQFAGGGSVTAEPVVNTETNATEEATPSQDNFLDLIPDESVMKAFDEQRHIGEMLYDNGDVRVALLDVGIKWDTTASGETWGDGHRVFVFAIQSFVEEGVGISLKYASPSRSGELREIDYTSRVPWGDGYAEWEPGSIVYAVMYFDEDDITWDEAGLHDFHGYLDVNLRSENYQSNVIEFYVD